MDILKVLVIIAFVIVTICTIKIHPPMHQQMIIEDANFTLTRISDNLPNASEIPTTSMTSQQISVQPQDEQSTKTVEMPQQNFNFGDNSSTQTKYVQSESPKSSQSTKPIKFKNRNPQSTSQQELGDISDMETLRRVLQDIQSEIDGTQSPTSRPSPTQYRTTKPQNSRPAQNSNFKNPYMTEQEEIIAWNRWRSNIQNQIMKDSNIDYAPLGTMFMFNFVVDKFGNVSNIKVECSNPNYMNVARNRVKPAIANLQKRPILNFPRGTQRTSTVVTGLFLIGTQERYSTPNDFSDFERVKN